jgi:hypothetical protein
MSILSFFSLGQFARYLNMCVYADVSTLTFLPIGSPPDAIIKSAISPADYLEIRMQYESLQSISSTKIINPF